MRYRIEPIGTQFSDRDLRKLEERFAAHAAEGYRFHSVFEVSQPGCLGLGKPSVTYVAVYEHES